MTTTARRRDLLGVVVVLAVLATLDHRLLAARDAATAPIAATTTTATPSTTSPSTTSPSTTSPRTAAAAPAPSSGATSAVVRRAADSATATATTRRPLTAADYPPHVDADVRRRECAPRFTTYDEHVLADKHPRVFVAVMGTAESVDARAAVRASWLRWRALYSHRALRVRFFIEPLDAHAVDVEQARVRTAMRAENDTHGDVVELDADTTAYCTHVVDGGRRYKAPGAWESPSWTAGKGCMAGSSTLAALLWATAHAADFDYYVRVDHDTFVCLPRLMADLRWFPRRDLLWGKWWCSDVDARPDENFMVLGNALMHRVAFALGRSYFSHAAVRTHRARADHWLAHIARRASELREELRAALGDDAHEWLDDGDGAALRYNPNVTFARTLGRAWRVLAPNAHAFDDRLRISSQQHFVEPYRSLDLTLVNASVAANVCVDLVAVHMVHKTWSHAVRVAQLVVDAHQGGNASDVRACCWCFRSPAHEMRANPYQFFMTATQRNDVHFRHYGCVAETLPFGSAPRSGVKTGRKVS